jgi:histidyl-tRNA synthetase
MRVLTEKQIKAKVESGQLDKSYMLPEEVVKMQINGRDAVEKIVAAILDKSAIEAISEAINKKDFSGASMEFAAAVSGLQKENSRNIEILVKGISDAMKSKPVEMPIIDKPKSWRFTLHRNNHNFITHIEAEAG